MNFKLRRSGIISLIRAFRHTCWNSTILLNPTNICSISFSYKLLLFLFPSWSLSSEHHHCKFYSNSYTKSVREMITIVNVNSDSGLGVVRIDHDSSSETINNLVKESETHGWKVETFSIGKNGCVIINAGQDTTWRKIEHGSWRTSKWICILNNLYRDEAWCNTVYDYLSGPQWC